MQGRETRMAKDNLIIWNLTRSCNFQCPYCYFPHDASPVKVQFPLEKLESFLASTGKEWVIGMTGGEPFLYPGFLDICERLTRNHIIRIDTNLSLLNRVREFTERIDPARVRDLYVSLHIEERERKGGVETFIEAANLLKEKGFIFKVNYVLHPNLVSRFAQDKEFYGGRGVELTPRPFKGIFENKVYPTAYSDEAKAHFKGFEDAGKKMVFNFQGVPCEGGRSFIRLDPDGAVFRCSGDRTVLGNLNDSVTLNTEAEPCRVPRCPCQGSNWTIMTPAQERFVEGMQHFVTGDLDKAGTAFQEAAAMEPRLSNAVNNLGVVHSRRGEIEDALRCFENSLEMSPNNRLYASNLAQALVACGREREAETLCGVLDAGQGSPDEGNAPDPEVSNIVDPDAAQTLP